MKKKNDIRIILASGSERRIQLLKKIGLKFKSVKHYHDENHFDLKEPVEFVLTCSKSKALSVKRKKNDLVVGADTIVYLGNEIIGKPKDKKDAIAILKKLSGKKHLVYTGLTLVYKDRIVSDYSKTLVFFKKISLKELKWYLEKASYLDKAGAYAVQDEASIFIKRIDGDFFNVVGFPISLFVRLFERITSKEFVNFLK